MREVKRTNNFLIILLLILTAMFSVGASSWLIINESGFSPILSAFKETPILRIGAYYDTYEGETPTVQGELIAQNSSSETLEGRFVVDTSSLIFTPGTSKTTVIENVPITFYPTDTSLYNTATGTIASITLHAVANIGSTYYGTVESAINSAVSGNTVNILNGLLKYPNLSTSGMFSPTMRETATIKSGVIVNMKYAQEGNYGIVNSDGVRNTAHRQNTTYNIFGDSKSGYKTNEVIIGSGVTLYNNGTLNIGGLLGGVNQPLMGYTSGNYSQITMSPNSQIISNGVIDCLGFIKELTTSGIRPKVTINTGTVYAPFVIYDYWGGSHTAGAYRVDNKIAPFTIYDMPNIQAEITYHSDSNLVGYADLYTGATTVLGYTIPAQHNMTDIGVIGSSSSVINLTAGAYAVCKYTPYTLTQSVESLESSRKLDGRTKIDIYGGASNGAMEMTVTVPIIGDTNIDTSQINFPVCWKYDFHLHSGTYNITTALKVLPGASITVGENATLNTTASVSFVDKYNPNANDNYAYPQPSYTDTDRNGEVYGNPRFIVNGTANISGAFGGFIESESEGAVLNLATSTLSVSTTEFQATRDGLSFSIVSATQTNYTTTTTGNTTTADGEALTGGGTFYRSNDEYKWGVVQNPRTYTVNCYNNDGTSNLSSYSILMADDEESSTVTQILAPDPVRKYYDFAGWYTDSACTTPFTESTLSAGGTLTVYAKWTLTPYSVNYTVIKDDGTLESLASTTDFNYSNLPQALSTYAVDGYVFIGWLLSEDQNAEKLTTITTDNFDELFANGANSELTVFGFLTKATVYTVTFNKGNNDEWTDTNNVLASRQITEGTKLTFPIGLNTNDYNASLTKYFIGWEDNYGNSYSATDTPVITADTTFTAVWGDKVKVVITDSADNASVTSTTVTGGEYTGLPETTSNGFYLLPGATVTVKAKGGTSGILWWKQYYAAVLTCTGGFEKTVTGTTSSEEITLTASNIQADITIVLTQKEVSS